MSQLQHYIIITGDYVVEGIAQSAVTGGCSGILYAILGLGLGLYTNELQRSWAALAGFILVEDFDGLFDSLNISALIRISED